MGNFVSTDEHPGELEDNHAREGRPGLVRRRSSFAVLVAGAFSVEESHDLDRHLRSFTNPDKSVDAAVFCALLGIEELPWFGGRLLAIIRRRAEEEGVGAATKGGLTKDGWYMGVARGCKERRTATVRVLFDVCDEEGSGSLDHAGLCRLFQAAYCCGNAAWGAKPQVARFAAAALADNVIDWLVALKGPAAAATVLSPPPSAAANGSGAAENGSGAAENGSGAAENDSGAAANGADAANDDDSAAADGAGPPSVGSAARAAVTCSFTDLMTWVAEKAPLLHLCLTTFVHCRVFAGQHLPTEVPVYSPPEPQLGSTLLEGNQEVSFALSVYAKALQGHWLRLYTSDEDGLSFNRIAYKILGFGGPTLLLLRDRNTGALFGAFAEAPWRESNAFYGGPSSFLASLAPTLEIFPCKAGSEGHYQYLNLKGFSLPHGLGMGGRIGGFRLFLPESLDADKCAARAACPTFEKGPLLPGGARRFEVDAMEVWGVGGTNSLREAVEAQAKRREAVELSIAKARKVDKAKFAENEFDREMLLGKTFGATAQRQG